MKRILQTLRLPIVLCVAAALMASGSASRWAARAGQRTNVSPSVSVDISLHDNTLMAEPEIPLEVTFTSDQEVYKLAFEQLPPWLEAKIDIRDSAGKEVPQKPVVGRLLSFTRGLSSGPLFVIKPGTKWGGQILLDRLFDLSKPGKYSVRATTGTSTSKTLTFTIPVPDSGIADANSPVSMTLRAPYSVVQAGRGIPIELDFKNIAKFDVTWALWHGQPPRSLPGVEYDGGVGIENEFGTGLVVTGPQGEPVPLTRFGKTLDLDQRLSDEPVLPSGRFTFLRMRPGESLEQRMMAGEIFDLSKPGTYTIEAVRILLGTTQRFRSNPVTVTVVPADQAVSPAAVPRFWFSLSTHWDVVKAGSDVAVYINMINMSGDQIIFPRGWQFEYWEVRNSRGDVVAYNKNGQHLRNFLRQEARYFRDATSPNGQDPRVISDPKDRIGREPKQTIVGLYQLYDLKRPGRYTIQAGVFDEQGKAIVQSNKIILTIVK